MHRATEQECTFAAMHYMSWRLGTLQFTPVLQCIAASTCLLAVFAVCGPAVLKKAGTDSAG